MKQIKKRYWAFVLYPDSAPTDWVDILITKGFPFCISPLHNLDFNPTGEVKKAHYHIIICYDGPTTYNNVKNITEELNQPIPIPLEQVKGYFRYLTHKDNPEKAQYNDQDIQYYNGFNPDDYSSLTSSQIDSILKDLIDIIERKHIIEYRDLIELLRGPDMENYFRVAHSNTLFLNTYIRSKRHELNK